jgi:hypothetical protein
MDDHIFRVSQVSTSLSNRQLHEVRAFARLGFTIAQSNFTKKLTSGR